MATESMNGAGFQYQLFYNKLIELLEKSEEAKTSWNEGWPSGRSSWTELIMKIIHKALEYTIPGKKVITSIGTKDEFERSEYLNIDLMVFKDGLKFAQPFLILEHETYIDIEKLQYCAWKLLTVDAPYRVLVGYYNPKSRSEKYAKDMHGIEVNIQKVYDEVGGKGKNLLLLMGRWHLEQINDNWNDIFEYSIIGCSE